MSSHDDVTIEQQPPVEEQHNTKVGAAMWLGSAATHAAALALMALIYVTVADDQKEVELPPMSTVLRPEQPKPKPVDPEPVSTNPNLLIEQIADETQVPTPVDQLLVVDPGEEDAPDDLPPMVKGDSVAVSDIDMGSTAFFAAIGTGSNAFGKNGGLYSGRGRRGVKGPIGTPPICDEATKSALRWFKRHQSQNGMWDADGYFRNCSEAGAKCEPGKDQSGDTDVATTAYAVLCYLGDGYDTSTPSRYRTVVKKGIEWLLSVQKPDGLIGQRNYEHAIATMVLAQAYAMSNDPALREPTQKAVDVILARQNRDPAGSAPYDRLGWDYGNATSRNDASVTGWNVMALKSAMVAGLTVGEGLSGSKAWLEKSWKAANTDKPWCASTDSLDPYKDITRFGYVWKSGGNEVEISGWDAAAKRPESIANRDLAPVGLMSAVFLGRQQGDVMLETMANYVSRYHQPTAWPCNTYYLYYNTLGMFQVGGERWEKWAKQVLPMLSNAQRSEEGCLEGSWDWQGTQFHGHDTGRVLSTAYACLSMQVYWIYGRTTNPKGKTKNAK